MKAEPWDVLDDRLVVEASIFSVRKLRARSRLSRREHDFDILEAPDWVNVIPLTPEGRIVLVRQFRHGTGEITLEIPGGQVDPGEAPLEAAQRELREETGYATDAWEFIGVVEPNPAFQTNRTHTFLARGARPAGKQRPDENEEIEVVEEALDTVADLFATGCIRHALVMCAFYHLAARGEWDPGGRHR